MLSIHDRAEYVLECLVERESLDGVLATLIAIAEKKAKTNANDKRTAAQWNRSLRRLIELRAWCAEFGPGSGCR